MAYQMKAFWKSGLKAIAVAVVLWILVDALQHGWILLLFLLVVGLIVWIKEYEIEK